ncbi:MAG: hypothetical protein IPH80_38410 [Myxococcales bacterium]|nr:hypothetical protein [Myxococcales bacterium]
MGELRAIDAGAVMHDAPELEIGVGLERADDTFVDLFHDPPAGLGHRDEGRAHAVGRELGPPHALSPSNGLPYQYWSWCANSCANTTTTLYMLRSASGTSSLIWMIAAGSNAMKPLDVDRATPHPGRGHDADVVAVDVAAAGVPQRGHDGREIADDAVGHRADRDGGVADRELTIEHARAVEAERGRGRVPARERPQCAASWMV